MAVPRQTYPIYSVMNVNADGDPANSTVTVTGIATAGSTQQGAVANAAYTDATGAASGTMISLLKGIYIQLAEINAKTPDPA